MEEKQAELTAEKFAALVRDQVENRQLTDGVSDSVRQLGDTGAGALANLESAAGNMAGAEKNLGERHAEPASTEQGSAVENLRMARKQLAAELDKLLDQLRADVKRRVMEDLVLMLEKQTAIRESTATLGARGQRRTAGVGFDHRAIDVRRPPDRGGGRPGGPDRRDRVRHCPAGGAGHGARLDGRGEGFARRG